MCVIDLASKFKILHDLIKIKSIHKLTNENNNSNNYNYFKIISYDSD